MRREPLAAVRDTTDEMSKLREAAGQAEHRWHRAIRAALKAGITPTAIAEAAKISRTRVYQIQDGTR